MDLERHLSEGGRTSADSAPVSRGLQQTGRSGGISSPESLHGGMASRHASPSESGWKTRLHRRSSSQRRAATASDRYQSDRGVVLRAMTSLVGDHPVLRSSQSAPSTRTGNRPH